jgi:hypothetical protein
MIVLDRIEGDLAVLEVDGATYHLPASALPEGCSEGCVLEFVVDANAERTRKAEAEARLERLKKRGPEPGGTLVL